MADRIPSVIQIEILCRLPVKSLIRFRLVSKEWKSLTQSHDFNSDYIVRQAKRPRLLITNVVDDQGDDDVSDDDVSDDDVSNDDVCNDDVCCWVVDDDDSFPQHKICLTYPPFVNLLTNLDKDLEFVGSSHGLLCFSCLHIGEDDTFDRYVIWNPSIKKSLAIDMLYYPSVFVSVGFGVCPNSLDPKLVKIVELAIPNKNGRRGASRQVWRVEVFTINSGMWRSPLIKLPSKFFKFNLYKKTPLLRESVCVGVVREKIDDPRMDHGRGGRGTMSFQEVCTVWLMDHVSKSFTKLFTINLPLTSTYWDSNQLILLGLRDNNQLILRNHNGELVAFERYSKYYNNFGIYVNKLASLTTYTESLLLLDQSGTLNDDEGDAHTR
ncbi:F-box protein At3g57590-like [Rutidosis leptorrhynchoides]|uniref:F-box protein At3g57590-like n=1 Tax=Rutidosis leptorrhynchoides TaxID=125765 RepID=UPI003A98D676